MKILPLEGRTLTVAAIGLLLLALLALVAVQSGPLAPVAVTVSTVEARSITPGLFGVGTVEARYSYRIGPTAAGRVKRLLVDVGDRVANGQLLGEMDPVDLDDRVRAQEAALGRIEAVLREAEARQRHAQAEENRYEQLLAVRSTSEELLAARLQARQVADAALAGAREELARARADRDVLVSQRKNLLLVSPVSGLVAARDVEPGTTVVAGQAVVEVLDPGSLWVHVRFDQGKAEGLHAGLPAQVVLRSRDGRPLTGSVMRVEPLADAVTEELLAKVAFDATPDPLPSLGELGEVTVSLPELSPEPVVPNAAVHRVAGRTGVWKVVDGDPEFAPVRLGAADLDGNVQILAGLGTGDRVVVYSAKALSARSRIRVVERIPGVPQ